MKTVVSTVALSAFLVCIAQAHAEFTPPPNDGYVTIGEGVPSTVLSADEEASLERELQEYADRTSNQIAVLIVSSLDGNPIDQTAVEIGRLWGVGNESNDNGILLLISYQEREIFLATGYGLEGAVPDIVAAGIIRNELEPHFREGRFFAGISTGVQALQKHIAGEYTAERYGTSDALPGLAWIVFVAFILIDVVGALLARSRSWWAGGILGGVLGGILAIMYAWWTAIPLLVALGLIFDFVVSRIGYKRMRMLSHMARSAAVGGNRNGFRGFGGGSFGGGGARGKW